METIQISYPLQLVTDPIPETVAAIGFFDGIHKGHQKVIDRAVKKARELGMKNAVISFHPHPSAILNAGGKEIRYITPLEEKKKILSELGVDLFYIIDFNQQLSELSPAQFIEHFIKGLNIHYLVAGFDFTYGKRGQGNMKDLSLNSDPSLTAEMIPKQELDGEKISSTRIRNLLAEGEITKANELLGRPHSVHGIVVHGSKRGRELGWRTANLKVDNDVLLPKTGVYAVKVRLDGKVYNGMASLGYNPTFEYDVPDIKLEVHIFDFNMDIYDEELDVEWHKYIRDELKFSGIQPLIAQLEDDESVIRAFFAKQ